MSNCITYLTTQSNLTHKIVHWQFKLWWQVERITKWGSTRNKGNDLTADELKKIITWQCWTTRPYCCTMQDSSAPFSLSSNKYLLSGDLWQRDPSFFQLMLKDEKNVIPRITLTMVIIY